MPRQVKLGPTAQRTIEAAVDLMFDRLKARFLGPGSEKVWGKQLSFRFPQELTLTGLFNAAVQQEGVKPRDEVLKALLKIAGGYVDASREKTKSRVLQTVQAFLSDAQAKGVETDVPTVLGGVLTGVFGEAKRDIRRIVETETTTVRNQGIYDAIGRIGATIGVDDPTVAFVPVKDKNLCSECRRLHLMPDGVTPRAWKQSEVGAGYHTRGEQNPKVQGLHPHCRCSLIQLLKGYGFDKAGRVTYVSADYDVLADQRSLKKAEDLAKAWKQADIMAELRRWGWEHDKTGGNHLVMIHPPTGGKIPFQHGHSKGGDYDLPWVKVHLKEAGLKINPQYQVTADPGSKFYQHYVAGGFVKPETQEDPRKSWGDAATQVPIGDVDFGGDIDWAKHAKAVQALKSGQTSGLPAIPVMDLGTNYGTMDHHHLLQAARDAGYTHVPIQKLE